MPTVSRAASSRAARVDGYVLAVKKRFDPDARHAISSRLEPRGVRRGRRVLAERGEERARAVAVRRCGDARHELRTRYVARYMTR